MAPPPTPTSLMDLPGSWLLKLATSKRLAPTWGDKVKPVLPLFRTCAFFRDTVLQHRTAVAEFRVPIAAERFPAELARLCAVARCCGSVKLSFTGSFWEQEQEEDEEDDDDALVVPPWTHTEPCITHLLVCAMDLLGGPLACVKEVVLQSMERTALVPSWVRVCCPNVTAMSQHSCPLPARLPLDPPPPASTASTPGHPPSLAHAPPSAPRPTAGPLACRQLRSLALHGNEPAPEGTPALARHVREQLAALPALSSLSLLSAWWVDAPPPPLSRSLTRLKVTGHLEVGRLHGLLAQFPRVWKLALPDLVVSDGAWQLLLRQPELSCLEVAGFDVRRSHLQPAWAQQLHLAVRKLDVEAVACLPLDRVASCEAARVVPSRDAQAAARVAQAVAHWGGLPAGGAAEEGGGGGWRGGVTLDGGDAIALVTTARPLLAALPPAQRRDVCVRGVRDATPTLLQALGDLLPDSVAVLRLTDCTLLPKARAALLPSLPATVAELRLHFSTASFEDAADTEQRLVAICAAAVRPIRVVVKGLDSGDARRRVTARLDKMGQRKVTVCWKK